MSAFSALFSALPWVVVSILLFSTLVLFFKNTTILKSFNAATHTLYEHTVIFKQIIFAIIIIIINNVFLHPLAGKIVTEKVRLGQGQQQGKRSNQSFEYIIIIIIIVMLLLMIIMMMMMMSMIE